MPNKCSEKMTTKKTAIDNLTERVRKNFLRQQQQ